VSAEPGRGAPRPLSVRLATASARARLDISFAALDAVLVTCGYLLVLILRFDGTVPPEWWAGFKVFLPVAVLVHLLCNRVMGLYGRVWQHAGVDEARRLIGAMVLAGILLSVAYLVDVRRVPASVVALGVVVATIFVGGLRFQSRLFSFQRGGPDRSPARRVVVLGAGSAAGSLVRDMRSNHRASFRPVAILDDDTRKLGRSIAGVPIRGTFEDLPHTVAELDAELVVLAVPQADSALVRAVANLADAAGVPLKVLPSVPEVMQGQVAMRDVRDLDIVDLLGRHEVHTDLEAVRGILAGRRVLITGAGGSIGSELARQVAACAPAALFLLDHDETHLYEAVGRIEAPCRQVLADIRDAELMRTIFEQHRPEVVFHAAAHKHVGLLEDHACEAVHTNVFGTWNVVQAAEHIGVRSLVLISTDKAVHPSSVMGASKRVCEQVLLDRAPGGSRWCAVRFGNVLGSRGSVIPTFVRQIQSGGPVTVTDERMTRFFMSIEEAVQLVLQAAAMSRDTEVFMLDMGEPVRIYDLAERMIRLSGRQVGRDIAIVVTGMRPGEKLAEELREPEESARPTSHPSILALNPRRAPAGATEQRLASLRDVLARRDDASAARLLFQLATERGAGDGLTMDTRHLSPAPVVELSTAERRATS
jgi:FlaA1/EpsC-like NDP-sugar epimerase